MSLSDIRNRIIERVRLKPGELLDHPAQAWEHPKEQAAALSGVLRELGQVDTLKAYRSERAGGALVCIDGHLRRSLDTELEWDVDVLDLSDAEADYMLATFDPVGTLKVADKEKLETLLSTVNSGEAAVQQMLADEATKAGLYLDKPKGDDPGAQVDKAEELREKWGVESGQLWQLGEHRLICGDCTDKAVVERVMGGEKADITFTSPPYNVSDNAKLSPHQSNGSKYVDYSDSMTDDEYLSLLYTFTRNTLEHCEYSFVNVQSLAGNKLVLIDLLNSLKDVYADTLIWDKMNAQPAMAKNVLNSQFEYIHVFSNRATRSIGTQPFRGTISNVVRIHKKASEVKEHNATFSVDLAEFFVGKFSTTMVIDPFLGSGTTLIACERLGRKCRAVEISPAYVAVALERWAQMTGGTPCLVQL